MTEYEYLELAYDYGESVASSALNIATVFFAYVIAAHFVGDKLPKAFAYFLTWSYSLHALACPKEYDVSRRAANHCVQPTSQPVIRFAYAKLPPVRRG